MNTRPQSRVNVKTTWNQPNMPFEQMPLFSYVRPKNAPAMARPPLAQVPPAGTAPIGFVRYLELARLRCQMVDRNVTALTS